MDTYIQQRDKNYEYSYIIAEFKKDADDLRLQYKNKLISTEEMRIRMNDLESSFRAWYYYSHQ